jgi:hypothetical protein
VPTRSYEIRVSGQIPVDQFIEFENVTAVVEPAETVLRSQVVDQAALHGILQRLHGLGLELLELHRLPEGVPPARAASTPLSS